MGSRFDFGGARALVSWFATPELGLMSKQASGTEIQDQSPPRGQSVGPAEEPAQPPRIRPRPARPAPQEAVRLTERNSPPSRSSRAITPISASASSAELYEEANRRRGDTGDNLVELLERRLDAVGLPHEAGADTVRRASAGQSRARPRQRRRGDHPVLLGCATATRSSCRAKAKEMALVLEAAQSGERDVPDYVEIDHDRMSGRFIRAPKPTDVPYPVTMEPNLVIEYLFALTAVSPPPMSSSVGCAKPRFGCGFFVAQFVRHW